VEITQVVAARFWSHVHKREAGECWLWSGGQIKRYGQTKVDGKSIGAHRLSWIIANNADIPVGICVCHSCDVTACVNPAHLFLGTTQENTKDRDIKGRHRVVFGDKHYAAKLTTNDVVKIKALFAKGGISRRKIAKQYGVAHTVINHVINGSAWKHVKEN